MYSFDCCERRGVISECLHLLIVGVIMIRSKSNSSNSSNSNNSNDNNIITVISEFIHLLTCFNI